MSDCIFCKIVAGQLPCYRVYQDDLFLGFLDIRPLSPGNTLLVPQKHYRWIVDIPEFGPYFQAAKKIALSAQEVAGADYVTFLTLGTEVKHAHLRIIPRFFGDAHGEGIKIASTVNISADEMARLAHDIQTKINS